MRWKEHQKRKNRKQKDCQTDQTQQRKAEQKGTHKETALYNIHDMLAKFESFKIIVGSYRAPQPFTSQSGVTDQWMHPVRVIHGFMQIKPAHHACIATISFECVSHPSHAFPCFVSPFASFAQSNWPQLLRDRLIGSPPKRRHTSSSDKHNYGHV